MVFIEWACEQGLRQRAGSEGRQERFGGGSNAVGGRGRKGRRREKDEREGRVRENEHKESRREKWKGKVRDEGKDGAMLERGKIINKQTRKKRERKGKKRERKGKKTDF